MSSYKSLVALAGQPNCGKSTVFNALTGASQHVANYPGVTVEKMSGSYRFEGASVELVDLPGTYSLTSYSLEERVARDFILHDKPSVVVNIMDASNIKRNLYLTFQLLEMEAPVVVVLNMMDVAERRKIGIDVEKLSERLGAAVVPAAIKVGRGKRDILETVKTISSGGGRHTQFRLDYGELEPFIDEVESRLQENGSPDYPARWLAVKLMEDDEEAIALARKNIGDADTLLASVAALQEKFTSQHDEMPRKHIAYARYRVADSIVSECVETEEKAQVPLSDRVDRVVCNRWLGPVILVGVIYMLYQLAIVQGYNLTNYTWPILAKIRSITEAVVPQSGFIEEPMIRALALWFVDSVNALLNYIPIFFILFALIAILEDVGYMPRMAFILDRLFSRFGLHGQSTLPMVLGGIYVGGCAVPGVMATKGIPDEKARIATMLVIPMLNCLAKIPLYILMVNIYFPDHKGIAMFFISTVTLLMALPVAKVLTMTVLKNRDSAPFIMEMPPYHLPTVRGVLGRAVERVWLFIRKIITIVAAVAVILFVLLQFPGLSEDRVSYYNDRAEKARSTFYKKIGAENPYAEVVRGENLMQLIHFEEAYKNARSGVKNKEKAKAIDTDFTNRNSAFFTIIKPKRDKEAKKVGKAFKKLKKERKGIIREIRKEKIDNSFLGKAGRFIEPVTQWAGFSWRVNVALLSAFAAKESSVATLGVLYQDDAEGQSLEKRMKAGESGFTSLHALALILFMALYPPCMATAIMIKVQSGEVKYMLLSLALPTVLGWSVASFVFTGGSLLGLTGLQAMGVFYCIALAATIGAAFLQSEPDYLRAETGPVPA